MIIFPKNGRVFFVFFLCKLPPTDATFYHLSSPEFNIMPGSSRPLQSDGTGNEENEDKSLQQLLFPTSVNTAQPV